MNFSICMIAKNEINTIGKAVASMKGFMENGGWVGLVDTGSIDGTPELARSLGVNVFEVGNKFITTIDKRLAERINSKFIVTGETNIVKDGSTLFDFASARNYIADKAPTDMVIAVDCDEYFTKLDYEKINQLINTGIEMFETYFIFAHDEYGKPVVEFIQNRFYNKKKMQYEGIVHEVPMGHITKIMQLPKDIYMLEHQQELGKPHRSSYIVGLALDCYQHLDKDRQSHYFARELMYTGRFKSAIKEFKRHTTMRGWPLEIAQSMIYIGDCYGKMGMPKEQVEWYNNSFFFNSERREALIRLAEFYKHNNKPKAVAAYAAAALEIPHVEYYANDSYHYAQTPHELLYWAKGWMGDIEGAKKHLLIAKDFQPFNPIYTRDSQYYFEYPEPNIPGWMSYKALLWLYETAKKFSTIAEVGSWKGRSTHALASGCKNGIVWSIDHFMGSADPIETGNEDVYDEFIKNVGHFKNLKVCRTSSTEGAKHFDNGFFDMVFIDAGHQYHEVIEDIHSWLPKCSVLLCGHDYYDWGAVRQAVDEIFGKPDEIIGGDIWVVYLDKRGLIKDFTKKIKDTENFSFIKKGDGEMACINNQSGNNQDNIKYEPILAEKLKQTFNQLDLMDNIYIPKFNNQRYYNCLLHRVDNNLDEVSNFYKTIIKSERKKIYVTNDLLSGVAEMLGAIHYVVPATINISEYDKLVEGIKNLVEDNCIIMFSCGLFAKPFIYECLLKNPNITCLDLGSAFDPFHYQSRTHQVSKEKMFSLYKGLYLGKLPTVSIILPTIGRPDGLKRCLDSIENLNYPKDRIELIVIEDEPRLGVPIRVKEGYEKSTGEYICYAANDIEFFPDTLKLAIEDSINNNKRLVALDSFVRNTEGYICEHFIIKRSLVEQLGGIFDLRFKHNGCDTILWERASKLNETMISRGKINHYHYSRIGSGIGMDMINGLALDSIDEDLKTLAIIREEEYKDWDFRKERNIERLALPITRWCNRRCPECTAVERLGFPADPVSIEELKWVGETLGPIKTIEITGGEPSGHPQFKWFAENVHNLFQCNDILLLTNGWAFKKDENLPLLLHFDRIYITHYTENFAALYKERPNTDLVKKISEFMKDYPDKQFWVQVMDNHIPNKRPVAWTNGCMYDYDKGDMISYHKGHLYGCCTSWQLDYRGKGIPLTKDWRDHLEEIKLPCAKCFLGVAR